LGRGRGILGVGLKEKFRTAPEGFCEGPFPALRELLDLGEEVFGDLDLRLRHTGNYPTPSI
jgi:hypothetical protein